MVEKSGTRKNLTPAEEPGNVSDTTARTIIKTSNRGKKILLIFSIPPETPLITIRAEKVRNTASHIIGSNAELENSAKQVSGFIMCP